MFKNISKSFSSLDDEDRPFASLDTLPKNEQDYEKQFCEKVKPHSEMILERFHLDRFDIVQDIAFHFYDLYPDGEVTLYEFIHFHIRSKKGTVKLWRHIFFVLAEHTDEYGRFQKRRNTMNKTIRTVVDRMGLKLKEEQEEVDEEETFSTLTLNFFQMLSLYLFSHLKSSKELFRFVFYFLALPDDEEEESEGENNEEEEEELESNPAFFKNKSLSKYSTNEYITVNNLELLMGVRKHAVNLDSNLHKLLNLKITKRKGVYSDRELAKLFIQKLVKRHDIHDMFQESEDEDIDKIDRKEFKKSFNSMKEYQRFLVKCFEDRTNSFVNYAPSIDSLKTKSTEEETNKRNNIQNIKDLYKYITIIREKNMSKKAREIEDKFLHYVYIHPSRFLQFRQYKHPCELEFYQKEVMKLPTKFKLLFRKFYGRFTFFDKFEFAVYYLAFSKKRNHNPKIRLERVVSLNFSQRKFYIDQAGAQKTQIKMDSIVSRIVMGIPKNFLETILHSLNEEMKKLLEFLRRNKHNFDQCWIRIDIIRESVGDKKNNYFVDMYFDSTKHMALEPRGSPKMMKKIDALCEKCEKMLKKS